MTFFIEKEAEKNCVFFLKIKEFLGHMFNEY